MSATGSHVTGVGTEAGESFSGNVVVASGGFERNPALVSTFLRQPVDAPAGPPTNIGDGLLMGMAVGAKLGNMSEAWWSPAIQVPTETIDGAPFFRMIFTDCAQSGGILVNGYGRRFVNEATNYNDLGRSLHGFDAAAYRHTPTWLIFDSRRLEQRGFGGDPVRGAEDGGAPAERPAWIASAASIEELAEAIGVSPRQLSETVDRFNAQARAGADLDFGRSRIYIRSIQSDYDRPEAGERSAVLRSTCFDRCPWYEGRP